MKLKLFFVINFNVNDNYTFFDKSPTYFNCSHIGLGLYHHGSQHTGIMMKTKIFDLRLQGGWAAQVTRDRPDRVDQTDTVTAGPTATDLVVKALSDTAVPGNVSVSYMYMLFLRVHGLLIFNCIFFLLQKDHINRKGLTDFSTILRQ